MSRPGPESPSTAKRAIVFGQLAVQAGKSRLRAFQRISESIGCWQRWGFSRAKKIRYLVCVIDKDAMSRRYEALRPALTELGRRLFTVAEAMTAGYGGVTAVS